MKKGSAAAKAWGRKMKALRSNSQKRSTKLKPKTMVRRKYAKKKVTRRKPQSLKPMQLLIGGGIYGAGRAKVSNMLTPITSKIPLGNIADEAVLFGLGMLAHKKIKDKTVKSIAMAAMSVEAARMGEAIVTGQIGIGGNSTASVDPYA